MKTDVAIIGGGLAGLTLALQLRQQLPQLSVTVLERNRYPLPEAAHKVGESTVEIGAWYFAEVLGLRDYLMQRQLRKQGLRFFFGAGNGVDFARADELGPSAHLSVPSYQLDRGRLENDLAKRARERGIQLLDGCKAGQPQIDVNGHRLVLRRDGEERRLTTRWLIDAASRASPVKQALGLAKPNAHHCDSAWFRIDRSIRLDHWTADAAWQERGPDGRRWLSTNHLMGPGYWVWLIPLSSGTTSIGIVADPALHPLESYNSFDKAMAWLDRHQPLCADAIRQADGALMDFRFLRHYSHDASQVFSEQRWALTGEAGVFLDPFYSPGSDFIGISNSMICDLIAREQSGEAIGERVQRYQQLYFSFYRSTLSLYQDQYPGFGDRWLMTAKVNWDYAYYWAVLALLFCHGRILDLPLIDAALPDLGRAQLLNRRAQQAFARIGKRQRVHAPAGLFFDQSRMPLMVRLNAELMAPSPEDFRQRLATNVATLETLLPRLVTFAEDGSSDAWLAEQLRLAPTATA